NLILVAFYPYTSELHTDVCIDGDVHNINENNDDVCQIREINPTGGQGGPVEITQIKPQFSDDERGVTPQYIIRAANSGSGRVFRIGAIEQVASSVPFNENVWDIVYIEAELSGEPMTCEPMEIDLSKPESYARCSAGPIPVDTNPYTTPLVVRASYGYQESLSKSIRITKSSLELH
ncbi:MAG: hypothetical protein JRI71_17380, partial [Deltaproteobacteria bacterium]|nr:hypothetical protein [Deltaproteobacteria bacterium]